MQTCSGRSRSHSLPRRCCCRRLQIKNMAVPGCLYHKAVGNGSWPTQKSKAISSSPHHFRTSGDRKVVQCNAVVETMVCNARRGFFLFLLSLYWLVEHHRPGSQGKEHHKKMMRGMMIPIRRLSFTWSVRQLWCEVQTPKDDEEVRPKSGPRPNSNVSS